MKRPLAFFFIRFEDVGCDDINQIASCVFLFPLFNFYKRFAACILHGRISLFEVINIYSSLLKINIET